MANPRRHGRRHYAGDRYSPNDDDIKALGFVRAAGEEERPSAVLSDPTIWATIADVPRQSPA
jgi:hypothetical protein